MFMSFDPASNAITQPDGRYDHQQRQRYHGKRKRFQRVEPFSRGMWRTRMRRDGVIPHVRKGWMRIVCEIHGIFMPRDCPPERYGTPIDVTVNAGPTCDKSKHLIMNKVDTTFPHLIVTTDGQDRGQGPTKESAPPQLSLIHI